MSYLAFNGQPIKNGQFVPLTTAQEPIGIYYNANSKDYYTLVIYDISAPNPQDPYKSPYLQYLVNDIPGNDVTQGHELIDYMPPNPPMKSEAHTYVVQVYQQKHYNPSMEHKRRINFDLNQYIEDNGLYPDPVATLTFVTGYHPGKMRSVSPAELNPDADPDLDDVYNSDYDSDSDYDEDYDEDYDSDPSSNSSQKSGSKSGSSSSLAPEKKKFCDCLLDVAKTEPEECILKKKWFEQVNGQTCYNPAAVCAASVGTTSRNCYIDDPNYKPKNMDDNELRTFGNLLGIKAPNPYSRSKLLSEVESKMKLREVGRGRPPNPSETGISKSNPLGYLKVPQLRQMLRNHNLEDSGRKVQLIKRLNDHGIFKPPSSPKSGK